MELIDNAQRDVIYWIYNNIGKEVASGKLEADRKLYIQLDRGFTYSLRCGDRNVMASCQNLLPEATVTIDLVDGHFIVSPRNLKDLKGS